MVAKQRGTRQCPGCGAPAPSEAYDKNGQRFEFCACAACKQEYGRINGADHWLLLGTTTEHGLKISRRIETLPAKG